MVIRQKTMDDKIILTPSQRRHVLEVVDRDKKGACMNWGWSFTLYDSEYEGKNDYPFIHGKIFWDEENNDKVIEKVNNTMFDDSPFKYEDLSLFTNNYNAGDCHNAICSLIENDYITKWLLNEEIGTIHLDDPDDIETLTKAGLGLTKDGFSCIGQIKDYPNEDIAIEITDNEEHKGKYFHPQRIHEITSKEFSEWLDNQLRFEILENDSSDFNYYEDSVMKTIKEYRDNPERFIEDYPALKEVADQ